MDRGKCGHEKTRGKTPRCELRTAECFLPFQMLSLSERLRAGKIHQRQDLCVYMILALSTVHQLLIFWVSVGLVK